MLTALLVDTHYVVLIGVIDTRQHFLRPIVTIDLEDSKCNMIEKTNSDGERILELKWD